MNNPLILVIDDSPTIRKMVECHLLQAGYRVELATDAEEGVEAAEALRPDLILLDHQLPGTTGEEVCTRLLESEATASIPVLISSAMRNRAFARYADFSNVIDQIPKPFTPELLKSGVANALQTGAMVMQAQRTGCTMPESVTEEIEPALRAESAVFPFRAVFDFLTHSQVDGRITLEQGHDRTRFAVSAGRVQAVYSPSLPTDRLAGALPPELADLAPLTMVTLGEHQDASMSGLVRLLERSLADPRRLRALLRFQAAWLTYHALTGGPGPVTFEPGAELPPMFRAFPLQISLPALAIEGVRYCEADTLESLAGVHFAKKTPRGGNLDRTGLSPAEIRAHTLLDGNESVGAVAARAGLGTAEVAVVARGLELVDQADRRSPTTAPAILLLEDDPETLQTALHVLGPEGDGYQLRHVRDRVAAQLLLKRNRFTLLILPVDTPDQEAFYHSMKALVGPTTRVVGLARFDEESQIDRLDSLGLDGVIRRPVTEPDLRDTVRQLIGEACAGAV